MANKKAKLSAARRINKIDHFLNLLEGMTHKLSDKDTQIIATFLARRVERACEKITNAASTDIFNIEPNPVPVPTFKNPTDIYCAWCKCWHDKALHANESSLPKTI
jgi:hypothetical protein|tara:strand:+ start:1436 stop:1753 length:318 start_codon:yes stop_codon:yes gene_type:complete